MKPAKLSPAEIAAARRSAHQKISEFRAPIPSISLQGSPMPPVAEEGAVVPIAAINSPAAIRSVENISPNPQDVQNFAFPPQRSEEEAPQETSSHTMSSPPDVSSSHIGGIKEDAHPLPPSTPPVKIEQAIASIFPSQSSPDKWVELSSKIQSYRMREGSVREVVYLSDEAYNRLRGFNALSGITSNKILLYLLDVYLPKPSKPYMTLTNRVGASIALDEKKFKPWDLPPWFKQYPLPKREAVALNVDPYLGWKFQEFLNRGFTKADVADAVCVHFLPESYIRYPKKHRRY
jgi:hypothetical protein